MRAKCENINGIFTAMSVVDIPSDSNGADVYTEVPEWKNTNNYSSEFQIACWPKIALDDKVFHLSTQLIGLMNSIDIGNGDIPFESPSNKNLQMNACVDASGKEIDLGIDQANYLNGQTGRRFTLRTLTLKTILYQSAECLTGYATSLRSHSGRK